MAARRAGLTPGQAADRTLARLDELRPELVGLVQELVRVPSVTPTYPGQSFDELVGGEAEAAGLLAAAWRELGAEVERFGEPGRENAVGELRGAGGGRSLMLNGHVDVVPAGDPARWSSDDPFSGEVTDGSVWGRGSVDMKAGLAAQAFAARALHEAGVVLRGDLVLQAVAGEENAEPVGTQAAIERGSRADAAIVAEPTGFRAPLSIMPATPGLLGLAITVAGKSTHAGNRGRMLRPDDGGGEAIGVSAIDRGIGIYHALRRLEDEWAFTKVHPLYAPGQFTINPGLLMGQRRGALIPAFVPDELTLGYAVFYPPGERAEDVRREVETQVERAAGLDAWLRRHPPAVDWIFHCPPSAVAPDHPICTTLAEARRVATEGTATAGPGRVEGFPSFCDATWLCRAGIPAVSFGPGDGDLAHADDEHCDIEEIVCAARAYALAAIGWCGV